MAATSESSVAEPRSSSVEISARRAVSRIDRLERRDGRERALLASDAEPYRGLDKVHRKGLQPGGERSLERDEVCAEDRAGRDAVGAIGRQAA